MASRRAGSNQYTQRTAAAPAAPTPDLVQQVAPAPPVLCGQVHGGSCPAPVHGPTWQCSQHDTETMKILAAIRADRPEILQDLSQTDTRDLVAENSACPAAVLDQLSRDGSQFVRGAVARNSNCPEAIALRLSRDPDPLVRRQTVRRDSALPAVLEILAADRDSEVREEVARHPGTPVNILLQLLNDRVLWVASAAADNPNLPSSVLAMWQLGH